MELTHECAHLPTGTPSRPTRLKGQSAPFPQSLSRRFTPLKLILPPAEPRKPCCTPRTRSTNPEISANPWSESQTFGECSLRAPFSALHSFPFPIESC